MESRTEAGIKGSVEMIEIKEEDIELDFESVPGIWIHMLNEIEAKQLKQQILQNQKLRELVENYIKANPSDYWGITKQFQKYLEESKN